MLIIMWLKLLILILGVIVGTLFVRYSYQLTQLFGHNSYAERYIGEGGTYSMWKLLGIAVIIFAAWFALS